MQDPAVASSRRVITVSGRDPRQLVTNLVDTLSMLTLLPGHQDEPADAGTVAPFQAEARTMTELALGLVDDVLASIAESTTEIVGLEVANVLTTDHGWRAWGYVRFGSATRRGVLPSIAVASYSCPTTPEVSDLQLIITSAFPASPIDSDPASSNGTMR